jgi:hypothetical protein
VSDRCPSCGLSPYERGIGDSDISRIVAERNVLVARLEALAATRDDHRFEASKALMTGDKRGSNLHFAVAAALSAALQVRQPSQEQPVPCDQHDAGHQAGWA